MHDTVHPSDTLQPGSRVDEFQIISVLALGRESVVYRARDRARACEVALKEYLPAAIAWRNARGLMVTAAGDAATFDAGRRAFLRHAMELARLQHASLLRVHRSWQHAGSAYVAMPLVQGRTLQQMIDDRAVPDAADLLPWIEGLMRPLLDLLTVLHRRHCVGLDLSADRLLVQGDGRPLLMSLVRRDPAGRPAANPLSRPTDDAWRDLQALAQTLLLVAPQSASCNASLTSSLMGALHDAAAGDPARRPADAQAWMQALGLPERRSRVRLNRELQRAREAGYAPPVVPAQGNPTI